MLNNKVWYVNGVYTVERANEKIGSMLEELKKWKELSVSADFK
jgi:hypothetical protein